MCWHLTPCSPKVYRSMDGAICRRARGGGGRAVSVQSLPTPTIPWLYDTPAVPLIQKQDQLSSSFVITMGNWGRAVRSKLDHYYLFPFPTLIAALLRGKRAAVCLMLSRQWKVLSPWPAGLKLLTQLKAGVQLELSTQIQNRFRIRWQWKSIIALK